MATKSGQQKTEPATRKPGKLLGYARVSTTDQDLALQREALEGAGRAAQSATAEPSFRRSSRFWVKVMPLSSRAWIG
jgi:hypothetical protein